MISPSTTGSKTVQCAEKRKGHCSDAIRIKRRRGRYHNVIYSKNPPTPHPQQHKKIPHFSSIVPFRISVTKLMKVNSVVSKPREYTYRLARNVAKIHWQYASGTRSRKPSTPPADSRRREGTAFSRILALSAVSREYRSGEARIEAASSLIFLETWSPRIDTGVFVRSFSRQRHSNSSRALRSTRRCEDSTSERNGNTER